MSSTTVDVAVIGAGVIGSAAAWRLADAGLAVALIDRSHPAAGSSGASDGYLAVSTKTPGPAMALAAASRARYPAWLERLGPVDAEVRGGALLVDHADGISAIEAHARHLAAHGIVADLVDGTRLRQLEPALSPHLVAGLVSETEMQLNPYKLALAMVSAGIAAGVKPYWPATPRIDALDQGGATLTLGNGERVIAHQIVLAAGAASEALGAAFGLTLPVAPRQGVLAITAKAPPLASRFLVSARYLTHKRDPALASTSADPLEQIGHGFTCETLPTGQHIIGSSRRFVGFDRSVPPEVLAAIVAAAITHLPALADRTILRAFAGLRPFVPDNRPLLGRSTRQPAVIVATGHEGDGVTLAPITAEVVAALVQGRAPPVDLAGLEPDRFAPA
jgi:sarcosine oxidase subunit beta